MNESQQLNRHEVVLSPENAKLSIHGNTLVYSICKDLKDLKFENEIIAE